MSTIAATNLKNASSGSNNIVLGSDGSSTLSTAKITTLADSAGSNTSTPAEIASGRAKAWVNFNGTGTVAIRASYNVSSITDNGVGSYTVNFTTAMTDTSFSVVASVGYQGWPVTPEIGQTKTTSSVSIGTLQVSSIAGDNRTAGDNANIHVAIFR